MMVSSTLRVKIFADGADRAGMLDMYRHPLVKGFTTKPHADAKGRCRGLPCVCP